MGGLFGGCRWVCLVGVGCLVGLGCLSDLFGGLIIVCSLVLSWSGGLVCGLTTPTSYDSP